MRLLDTDEPSQINIPPDSAATRWRIGVCGVAVGATLIESTHWRWVWRWLAPIAVALVLLFLARWALAHKRAGLVWSCSVGLVGVTTYFVASTATSTLQCLTDPDACNWGVGLYLSYAASWALVIIAPLVGAFVAVARLLWPQRWGLSQAASVLWFCALATSVGAVLSILDVRWLVLGVMALMTVGGMVRDADGPRPLTTLIAIVLSAAIVAVVVTFGVGMAIGCANRGSCGWTWYETLAAWMPALVVVGSIALSIVALFSRPPAAI